MSRNRPLSPILRDAFSHQRRLREEFNLLRTQHYIAAEDATNGALLNADGRARGIDPMRLFSGNHAFANRYASEELKDWWAHHPRMTFPEFELQTYEAVPDDYYNWESLTA